MKYNINEALKKLEKAGIDPFGLKVNVSYTQNVHDFFIGNDDTQKYLDIVVTMENHIYKDDEECIEKYGVLYGKFITTFDHVTGRTLNYFDVIDSIDQDAYNCLSVFMRSNQFNDELMFQQFFYIDRIVIAKEYRGNGLGSILLEYIKYKFSDLLTAIVLQPLAFEQKEESLESFEFESKRLCRFYERHGFKKYHDKTWVYHEY